MIGEGGEALGDGGGVKTPKFVYPEMAKNRCAKLHLVLVTLLQYFTFYNFSSNIPIKFSYISKLTIENTEISAIPSVYADKKLMAFYLKEYE